MVQREFLKLAYCLEQFGAPTIDDATEECERLDAAVDEIKGLSCFESATDTGTDHELDQVTVQNVLVLGFIRCQTNLAPQPGNLYHVLPAPVIERFYGIFFIKYIVFDNSKEEGKKFKKHHDFFGTNFKLISMLVTFQTWTRV